MVNREGKSALKGTFGGSQKIKGGHCGNWLRPKEKKKNLQERSEVPGGHDRKGEKKKVQRAQLEKKEN